MEGIMGKPYKDETDYLREAMMKFVTLHNERVNLNHSLQKAVKKKSMEDVKKALSKGASVEACFPQLTEYLCKPVIRRLVKKKRSRPGFGIRQ
ncbi:MAG: hypothetical protein HC830_15565 [Bacteroidetes bacterium]|nr:hypothetical protein [Bacteroidota bacterium]